MYFWFSTGSLHVPFELDNLEVYSVSGCSSLFHITFVLSLALAFVNSCFCKLLGSSLEYCFTEGFAEGLSEHVSDGFAWKVFRTLPGTFQEVTGELRERSSTLTAW